MTWFLAEIIKWTPALGDPFLGVQRVWVRPSFEGVYTVFDGGSAVAYLDLVECDECLRTVRSADGKPFRAPHQSSVEAEYSRQTSIF